MIVGLFLLVVALAIAVVALAFVMHRLATRTLAMADRWRRDYVLSTNILVRSLTDAARDERELLYRTLISRNAGEFAQLERVRTTEPRRTADPRTMSREDFEAWMEEDARVMFGDDGAIPVDRDLPLVMEGQ